MTWVLLSSARGPVECQHAIVGLSAELVAEAARSGLRADIIDAVEASHGGLLSALVSVEGEGSDDFALSWHGTIQWVCPSPFRPGAKRKNWFVSGSIISPPPAVPPWRPDEIQFSAMRASGAGGQHVNTTNSAVRLVHLPTGIVAQAQEERSQHRNRSLAMARLAAALADKASEGGRAVEHAIWSRHDQLERGNPIRVYHGMKFLKTR